MDKRYQVFVSSTYADLKEERRNVIQTLMEMDCIASGMELFPAADEEQFQFIKRVINDCDYYLLIIGGRYGSTAAQGVSFTEKEYDYAVSIGLKVLAFLHENPDDIVVGKTDKDPDLARRLIDFRKKVETGRLVKYWRTAADLPGLVALSLSRTIKTYPAIGWVRANQVGSNELLSEINIVRKENEGLRSTLSAIPKSHAPFNLASLSESFTIHCEIKQGQGYNWQQWTVEVEWGQIFAFIAPHLLSHPSDSTVQIHLYVALLKHQSIRYVQARIDDHDFQTIKVQLKALGLVSVIYSQTTKGGMDLFWSLTPAGETAMTELRAVRSMKPSEER